MDKPVVTITITKADTTISDKLSNSIKEYNGFKYTYLKQLVSRLRIFKQSVNDLSTDEQISAMGNFLITERNIANFAADQYAILNHDELFNDLMEIVEEIEELFK